MIFNSILRPEGESFWAQHCIHHGHGAGSANVNEKIVCYYGSKG